MTIEIVLAIIQIAILSLAGYYSYSIYGHNRLHKEWLAVTMSVTVMVAITVSTLALETKLFSQSNFLDIMLHSILPLIASFFLMWGLKAMKGNFENFDVVEKEAQIKAKKIK